MQPAPGDLICIEKPTSAILVGGDLGKDTSWGYALITIEANHTGLILETYNPKGIKKSGVQKAADELIKDRQKNQKTGIKASDEITIMVITIGTNILETVYDPEYMTILSI